MENKNQTCGICLNSIGIGNSNNYTTKCNHIFHNKCITHWLLLNTNCPICRKELDKHSIKSNIKIINYRLFIIPETNIKIIFNKVNSNIDLIDEMFNNEDYMFNTRFTFKKNNSKEFVYMIINKINNKYLIDIYDIDNIYNISSKVNRNYKIKKYHNKNYLRRYTKYKDVSF